MKPIFSRIKLTKPKSNVFDLSHERKLSCKMGDLIPIFIEDVVPGDKFRVNTEILVRLAPMLAPMMHRVNVYTHFFFVPNRLVFEKWGEFITGGEDGTSTVVPPFITINEAVKAKFVNGSLSDFLGIQPVDVATITRPAQINGMPFRAYQLIWNEYYRDQNLQPPVSILKTEGEIITDELAVVLDLQKRCWEKDYFTSALPYAQRGDAVLLPMQADINYLQHGQLVDSDGNPYPQADQPITSGPAGFTSRMEIGSAYGNLHNIESIDNSSITINDLRRATRLQEWLEKNMRSGSRYIEQIFAHFGVRSSDARLQRPEYLGGSKQPISISEVLSTYSEDGTAPQGSMAGHGVSGALNQGFSKFFEEHGFVIGIMSIMPRTAYMQGIPKMFSRMDKFDYFFPEFANIGEQEISRDEVFYDYDDATYAGEPFGYLPRYAEYKTRNSSVHGDFRSSYKYWHMAREFTTPPPLNEGFVSCDPTNRVFAVTDPAVDKVYVQLYNSVRAIRPMPLFGTPTL